MSSSGKLIDRVQTNMAVLPLSRTSGNTTGAYFSMAGFGKAIFHFCGATIAKTYAIVGQVYQAKDAAAGSAAVITAATKTITANTAAKKVLLTGNTIVDETSTVTINDVVYTCEDTTPDIDAGEFISGNSDTDACVQLAAAINHLQGDTILATPSSGTVILTEKEPGSTTGITVKDEDSTIVVSTLEIEGTIEVDASDLAEDFTHVAINLATTSTVVVGATITRAEGRYSPAS